MAGERFEANASLFKRITLGRRKPIVSVLEIPTEGLPKVIHVESGVIIKATNPSDVNILKIAVKENPAIENYSSSMVSSQIKSK